MIVQRVMCLKRQFVMMPIFDKQWKDMGLDDSDLQLLQILAYPKNEKDNLSAEERNSIRKMIENLEKNL